jgi:iron complex outermembrane recepter protein
MIAVRERETIMTLLTLVSHRACCTALLCAMAGASPLFAQETAPQSSSDNVVGLEEIVVTAQRRAENLQDVPISVTAINANSLAAGGVNGLTQINQAVPSVQLTRSGPGAIFFIRGVGNSSGGTGEEGANAFYVDGVYLGDLAQATTDFNNIERVEVLKGPQGTLFGRNATGGLINVITRDPGDEVVVKATAGYGNYQTFRGQLYVASPLTDNLSADVAVTGRDQNKGFGTNFATNEDVQLGWLYGFRSKWVWRPGDDTKIIFSGDYRKSSDDYTNGFNLYKNTVGVGGARYLGDYNINTTDPEFADLRAWGLNLTIEHDFDWATLTSITGRRSLRSVSAFDADYTPAPLTRAYIISGSKTFQEELRLASANTQGLSWQVGAFYYQGIADVFSQQIRGAAVGAGVDLKSHMKTTSYAAFGEVSYDITETTHLTGGLRYTKDKREFTGNQLPPTIPFVFLPERSISYGRATYRVALRQDLTDRINVYGSYNRGFKSGIFAMQAPTAPPVKPQTIDAFELGLKSQLFDNRVRFNIAGFHYKIKNLQVRSAGTTGSTTLLLNAATAKTKGIEAELEVAPAEGLRITGNATYLDSKFGSFPGNQFYIPNPATCTVAPPASAPAGQPAGVQTGPATGGFRPCFGDAAGNRTPLSPKFASTLAMSYTTPVGDKGELILTGLWSYTTRIYFESDNYLTQPAVSVFNGSIEYRPSDHWGIEVWGKNLGDKQYYITGVSGATGAHGELAAPRTYGITAKVDF